LSRYLFEKVKLTYKIDLTRIGYFVEGDSWDVRHRREAWRCFEQVAALFEITNGSNPMPVTLSMLAD
jgi:hypothetical protein